MDTTIDLRLFATLKGCTPDNGPRFPISKGMTIDELIDQLPIEPDQAKLVFVNGIRVDLDTRLYGGERVGIFPPVGGG